jgi:predicted TPR repeat methyltransferase
LQFFYPTRCPWQSHTRPFLAASADRRELISSVHVAIIKQMGNAQNSRAGSQAAVGLTAEELAETSATTLAHYNRHAESFWEGTRDHDVAQNRDALLKHLRGDPPFQILDLGCGPGRDLKVFKDMGHVAIGLEGAARFVERARSYSGCEVWHQDFLRLQLPGNISTASSPTLPCSTCRARSCHGC